MSIANTPEGGAVGGAEEGTQGGRPAQVRARGAPRAEPRRDSALVRRGGKGPVARFVEWRRGMHAAGGPAQCALPGPRGGPAAEAAIEPGEDAGERAAVVKPRKPEARIPWAELVRRVLQEDVLACPWPEEALRGRA